MHNFSFFNNKYSFSYFFLENSSKIDIEDEYFYLKNINNERINSLNNVVDMISNLEVFISLFYSEYGNLNSKHNSTMRRYDSYLIRTKDFNLAIEFNLSILNRVSRIKIEFVDKKKIRKFEAKNIVEFEKILEDILNKITNLEVM